MSSTVSSPAASPSTFKVLVSFAVIYLVWGTTYLAMKIAIESLPPVFIAGSRFFLAGAGMYAVMNFMAVSRPTIRQWRNAAITGTMLMAGGNGLVMLSIGNIPSGVAAVIVATMPLWTVLLDWLVYQGSRPNSIMILGLLLGFSGIVMLIDPFGSSSTANRLNVISCFVCLLAPIFWAAGSLQSRKMDLPSNPFMSGAAQMICGGALLLALSAMKGELGQIEPASVSVQSLLALLHLMVFGSVVGMTAYVWLLKKVSVARVSTYTYANPVIAVILGWMVLGETITPGMILAMGVVFVSVVIIVSVRTSSPARLPKKEPEYSSTDSRPHSVGVHRPHAVDRHGRNENQQELW